MSQFAEMVTKIVVDTKDAVRDVATFKNAASLAFKGTAVAAAAAAAAVVGVQKAISASVKQSKELQRASFFGAQLKDAQKFQKQVGGILTQMESLQEIAKFRQVGFTDKDIARATDLAKKIQVLGNVSLQTALEMVRTGDGVDKLSAALNLDMNTALDNTVKTMTNGVPRASDRARAALTLLTKETKNIKGNFDAMTQADPFTQLKVGIQDAGMAMLKQLTPELLKMSKDLKTLVPVAVGFFKDMLRAFATLVQNTKVLRESVAKAFSGKTVQSFAQAVLKVLGLFKQIPVLGKLASVGVIGGLESSLKKMVELGKEQQKQIGDTAKKEVKQVAKTASQVNKTLDAVRKQNRKRNQQARADRIQELKDFQSQARAQLRNFQQFALNNISSIGGTISGVIAAMKDTPEQLRILASQFAREIQGTNKLTLEQVLLQRQSGQLSDRQAKVAILLNTIRKAGKGDQNEFLRNQKTITRQLQAGLAISETSKKLAEVAAAQNDYLTDVKTSQNQLRMVEITQMVAIQGLVEKQQKQKGKLSLLDRLALGQARQVLANVRQTQKQYSQIAKQQKPLIALMKERALLEAQIVAPAKLKLELATKENQALDSLRQKQMELAALQGKLTQGDQVRVAGVQKLTQLNQELAQARITLDTQVNQLATAASKRDAAILQQRITTQQSLIASKEKELKLQQQINSAQQQQLTFAGSFQKRIFEGIQMAQSLGQKLGTTLGDAALGFAQTVGSSLARLGEGFTRFVMGVEDADLGKDLGKGFIDLLAGMAQNFAAVFASVGAGYIALGNVGQGAATLAAAGGLFALSGAIGALSSIADSPSAAGSGGASSAARSPAPSFQQSLGNDSQRAESKREVFITVVSNPWQKTDPQQRREFAKWFNKNKRIIGALG